MLSTMPHIQAETHMYNPNKQCSHVYLCHTGTVAHFV